jgi:polar amino acid transport system substrate-binding protein
VTSFALAETKEIVIVYGINISPPYILWELGKEDWSKPGLTVEYVKSLEKKLDVKVRFERMNWARGLEWVKANRADGIFHASYKRERLEIGVYPTVNGKLDSSRKLFDRSYHVYRRKGSRVGWDGKNFLNLHSPIGATINYAIVGDLEKMGVDVETTPRTIDGFRKLARGRIPGMAVMEAQGDYLLKRYPDVFGDIEKVSPALKSKEYFLMLSKHFVKYNKELSENIWNELRRIRESGELNAIYEKYFD